MPRRHRSGAYRQLGRRAKEGGHVKHVWIGLALMLVAGWAIHSVRRPERPTNLEPIIPEMVPVAGGVFTVGDSGWAYSALNEQRVDAFALGRTEVTVRAYRAFQAATARAVPDLSSHDDDEPASGMTWYDARAYAEWLSARTGRQFRLPTWFEWEVAARGSDSWVAFEWGDEDPWRTEVRGNVADQTAFRRMWLAEPGMFPLAAAGYDDGFPLKAPVGSFRPNSLGIFDLTGNVSEWCADAMTSETTLGPGDYRAIKGASFLHRRAEELRIGRRWGLRAATASIGVGLRLAESQ